MHVPNVTSARAVRAVPAAQRVAPTRVGDVPDDVGDEMAASDGAVTINRNRRLSRVAGVASRGVALGVEAEQRVDGLNRGDLVFAVAGAALLVGIQPKVDPGGQFIPESSRLVETVPESHHADAET